MNSIPMPLGTEVHVHCLTLPHHPVELAHLKQLLSPYETKRTDLLKSGQVRNNFVAGRGVLRKILGRYLSIAPENVQLDYGNHGKPFLLDHKGFLNFNLSHAGDLLILAVSAAIEVGIDIEKTDADIPLHDMARLAFSHQEQKELFELPSFDLQTTAFYRCWVRKEACMKACGRGFSLPSNSFDVSVLNFEEPNQTVWCDQKNWHLLDIAVPQNYSAALAVQTTCSATGKNLPKVTLTYHQNV